MVINRKLPGLHSTVSKQLERAIHAYFVCFATINTPTLEWHSSVMNKRTRPGQAKVSQVETENENAALGYLRDVDITGKKQATPLLR